MVITEASSEGFPQLYRYQSFDLDGLRLMLSKKQLLFSNPARFNDPWDCQPDFDPNIADDDAKREKHALAYLDIARRHFPNQSTTQTEQVAKRIRNDPKFVHDRIDEISKKLPAQIAEVYRVYCLSMVPNHELMWAHYANRHQGICLEFTSRSLRFSEARKVIYRKFYPKYDVMGGDEEECLAALLTKSKAWRHEKEYRLIARERPYAVPGTLTSENGLVPLPDGCLQAVIVGCLARPETVEAVRETISEAPYPIALKRAEKARAEYKLVISSM